MSLHIWQPSWSVNLFQIQNCNIITKLWCILCCKYCLERGLTGLPAVLLQIETISSWFTILFLNEVRIFFKLLTAVFLWAWFQHVYKYTNNLNSLNFQLAMTLHPGLPRARSFRVSSIWIQSRFWTLLQSHQQQ